MASSPGWSPHWLGATTLYWCLALQENIDPHIASSRGHRNWPSRCHSVYNLTDIITNWTTISQGSSIYKAQTKQMNSILYKAQTLLTRSWVCMPFIPQWCTVQFVHCKSLWVSIYLIVLTSDCEIEKTKECTVLLTRELVCAVLQVLHSIHWCFHSIQCHTKIKGHLVWAHTEVKTDTGSWGRWSSLWRVRTSQHFPFRDHTALSIASGRCRCIVSPSVPNFWSHFEMPRGGVF